MQHEVKQDHWQRVIPIKPWSSPTSRRCFHFQTIFSTNFCITEYKNSENGCWCISLCYFCCFFLSRFSQHCSLLLIAVNQTDWPSNGIHHFWNLDWQKIQPKPGMDSRFILTPLCYLWYYDAQYFGKTLKYLKLSFALIKKTAPVFIALPRKIKSDVFKGILSSVEL